MKTIFFFNLKENKEKHYEIKEENKEILEEFLQLQKRHEEQQEERNKKNKKSLNQIIAIVASDCLWDYDKVLNMTYYCLINSFLSIANIDSYKTYMQYKTSGQFEMKDNNIDHWMNLIGN